MRKEAAVYLHTWYHFAFFLKVNALLSFNLVFLLDNNITAVLLFVAAAAAAAHVFVDLEVHSEGGEKNKTVLNEKEKTLEHSLVN